MSLQPKVAHIDFFDIKFIIDCGTVLLKTVSSLKFDPIIEDLRKYGDILPNTNISPIDNFKNAIETNCLMHLDNRQIVLIVPLFVSVIKLQSLSNYFFHQHNVRSILPIYDCIASLLPLGLNNGLVIDFGYNYTTISPVFSYLPLKNSAKVTATSTRTLYKELFHKLIELGSKIPLDMSMNETIYNNIIYFNLVQMADYLPTIGVPCDFDFHSIVKEFLFNNSCIDFSVTELILEVLLECPIDIRRSLASNLVLTGGLAAVPHIRTYLLGYLEYDVQTKPKYKTLKNLEFKCHPHLTSPHLLSLAGGFIISRVEKCSSMYLDKERFAEFIKTY